MEGVHKKETKTLYIKKGFNKSRIYNNYKHLDPVIRKKMYETKS